MTGVTAEEVVEELEVLDKALRGALETPKPAPLSDRLRFLARQMYGVLWCIEEYLRKVEEDDSSSPGS